MTREAVKGCPCGECDYACEQQPVRPVVSRADLIEKLKAEMYETEAGYDEREVARREGWNARGAELVQWLKENA